MNKTDSSILLLNDCMVKSFKGVHMGVTSEIWRSKFTPEFAPVTMQVAMDETRPWIGIPSEQVKKIKNLEIHIARHSQRLCESLRIKLIDCYHIGTWHHMCHHMAWHTWCVYTMLCIFTPKGWLSYMWIVSAHTVHLQGRRPSMCCETHRYITAYMCTSTHVCL